ncbi:MAG: ABC transporter permease [Prevotellaceae bacterium]|jgi:ABC-2 type transport system permease protein|nr:ABC transporter permease [Prevotellaceae bacterium]
MNKIFLIIEREFLTRVKKKSFILMTLLTPLLFAALMVVPVFIQGMKDDERKTIAVIDQSGLAEKALQNSDNLTFLFKPGVTLDSLKQNFGKEKLYAVATISALNEKKQPVIDLYAFKQPNMDVQQYIERGVKDAVEQYKLESYHIQGLDTIIASIKTNVKVKTFIWGEDGQKKASHTGLYMGISYILSFMIYMFIFMFGNMVMRGVIEEKASRIIEVIVSSVKPFQLMMGKIIGIASVGLLQFIIWVVLTLGIVTVFQGSISNPAGMENITQTLSTGDTANEITKTITQDAPSILSMLGSINFTAIIVSFLLYFLLGYLLYASMFAAIGSAVENEADTQQLIIPVTIPLIIGIFLMLHTFQYPDSSLSFWSSIIPFTSPMVMMARIPFGVPFWQVALSLALLLITFIGIAWMAGKIYRTGILMYGKKPTLKEMLKWMNYKN